MLKSQPLNFLLVIIILASIGCKSYPTDELMDQTITRVDYGNIKYWAAHPEIVDPSDRIPASDKANDSDTGVDIFFIHPTTYTTYKGDLSWNADIDDQKLNDKTDKTTILYQASAFNSGGRVYAPRYRQAHIEAFYTEDRMKGEMALNKAYEDVSRAFRYYLDYENEGRSIIIASHSQGTRHAKVLLKDYFDGTELLEKLVAAYIIGIPVQREELDHIPVCQSSDDTACFISWRTFRKGHKPDYPTGGSKIAVVNPLSWQTSSVLEPKVKNKGSILRNFDKIFPELVEAQINDGLLWVNRPKFPGSFLFTRKNYHILDINLFYMNISENVVNRINSLQESSAD